MKAGSGEKKAKPGDKDYPKTLNVEQSYNNMANKPGAASLNFGFKFGKGSNQNKYLNLNVGGQEVAGIRSTSSTTGRSPSTAVSQGLAGIGNPQNDEFFKAWAAKEVAKERKIKSNISYTGGPNSTSSKMNNSVEHDDEDTIQEKSAAWQRKEGKNPTGGLNAKGRKSYERENPGSDLKAPQPEGGPRKRSFCARMGGVKGPMKDEKGRPTRKALALRKWKCSEETTNETTSLKDELLRTATKKHKDAKSYKKVMQQGKEAKDKLKDPKGIRGTSKGKWGYYKGGKFRPD